MRSGILVGALCYKWARSIISIYPIRLRMGALWLQGGGEESRQKTHILQDGVIRQNGPPWASSSLTSQPVGSGGHLGVPASLHKHQHLSSSQGDNSHAEPRWAPTPPLGLATLRAAGSQHEKFAGLTGWCPLFWFFLFSKLKNEMTWSYLGLKKSHFIGLVLSFPESKERTCNEHREVLTKTFATCTNSKDE